jgi:DNA-binding NarL/FixJ family response regulator
VNLVERECGSFDVVLLDLNMPVMHGRDALVAIRGLAPELPVLIISGFLADAQVQDLLHAGAVGVLQKPCRLADLSRHVSQAIKRKSGVARASA